MVCDPSPAKTGKLDERIREKVNAIAEFRSFFNGYRLRGEGTPVLVSPEQQVALWAVQNDPEHGRSRDTVAYVLRHAGKAV